MLRSLKTFPTLMLRNSGTWSCVATDSGHEIPHLQCEEGVKDVVDEDNQDSGQIINELQVRFNGSAGG